MDQREWLVAITSIDGEIAHVGGDEPGFWKTFGKDDERSIAGIHLRVFFEELDHTFGLMPTVVEKDLSVSNDLNRAEERGAVSAQMVAYLGPDCLGGDKGLIEYGQGCMTPSMPLIVMAEKADDGAGIDEISNRRSLHASKDRVVRLSSFLIPGGPILQREA